MFIRGLSCVPNQLAAPSIRLFCHMTVKDMLEKTRNDKLLDFRPSSTRIVGEEECTGLKIFETTNDKRVVVFKGACLFFVRVGTGAVFAG
jgi:hypothetical protein